MILFCLAKLNRLLLLLGGDMVGTVLVKVDGGMANALLLLAVVDGGMIDALLLLAVKVDGGMVNALL